MKFDKCPIISSSYNSTEAFYNWMNAPSNDFR